MKRIRVGIVGCGEVTQIVHLPTLDQLADRFQVTALCDLSSAVLEGVGDRWNINNRVSEYEDLVRREDVDAVLVQIRMRFMPSFPWLRSRLESMFL